MFNLGKGVNNMAITYRTEHHEFDKNDKHTEGDENYFEKLEEAIGYIAVQVATASGLKYKYSGNTSPEDIQELDSNEAYVLALDFDSPKGDTISLFLIEVDE